MTTVRELAQAARAASRVLANLNTESRNQLLRAIADRLRARGSAVLQANAEDMRQGAERGLSPAMLDRLYLDPKRLAALADAVDAIAAQPDPIGQESSVQVRADGLRLARMRVPLGVIAMIYESRPNVTIDAAALCLKSGNAAILRGGSEAWYSNQALATMVQSVLSDLGLPEACVQRLPSSERSEMLELLQCAGLIDLVIPRGGEGLIRFVAANSRIPVVQHYKGVCHLFVDRDANQVTATRLLLDGKASRPGVCNALETLLVDQAIAETWLPGAAAALLARGVELRGCARTQALISAVVPAEDSDWDAEYLAPILAIRMVDDLDAALAHIALHGSQHTEVIVTDNAERAARFQREVDASAVMWNASSRFNDGGELGLGAEIGISTTKIHAYGAMGALSLTTEKWLVSGSGHVRHPDLLKP
ncbi:glutamate-5-semialdehyde dehydrogenase [Ahniella affigens]|uniref:Gamma-glutamyl phosphate reductase n=1 Tax=Ahniella affigens TaxID=2021234 RepID=A0A2P1PUG3_9GAMM|nr:glutamate-5-semialdehyde dehydrogenase [Ahniella affigens]AVP98483.1 glutamate-5-semialdehyde dehydrogenase [Ahniella affigens]